MSEPQPQPEPEPEPEPSEPTVATDQTQPAEPDTTTATDQQPVDSMPSTSAFKPREDSETLTEKVCCLHMSSVAD